jgi:RecB family endonuclease NucS
VDEAEFEMHLSEEEMYEAIASNPDLLEPGFRILSHQRRLSTGVADFTGYDSQGRYTVIEVKRRAVDTRAVKQAYKYLSEFKEKGAAVRGIIAAPSISVEAMRLANTLGLEFKKIDLTRCRAAYLKCKEVSLLEQGGV